MAFAIVAIPKDKSLQTEVITPFPDKPSAARFAVYLGVENKWWDYYVCPAREPVPIKASGEPNLLRRKY